MEQALLSNLPQTVVIYILYSSVGLFMASKSRPLRVTRPATRASGVPRSRPKQGRPDKSDAQANNKAEGLKKQFSLRATGFRSVKLHAEDLVYKGERVSRKKDRGEALLHGQARPTIVRNISESTEQQSYRGEEASVDATQKGGIASRTRHSVDNAATRSGRGKVSRSPGPRTAVNAMLKYAGLKSKRPSFQVHGFRSVKWATKDLKNKPEHRSEEPTEESEDADPGNTISGRGAEEESAQGEQEQVRADPIHIEPWEGASRRRITSTANENDLITGGRSLWSMHYDNEPSNDGGGGEDDGDSSSSSSSSRGVDEIWEGGGGRGGGDGRGYHRKKNPQAYTFFALVSDCKEGEQGALDVASESPGWSEYVQTGRHNGTGREGGYRQEHGRNRLISSKYGRKEAPSDVVTGRRQDGTVSQGEGGRDTNRA